MAEDNFIYDCENFCEHCLPVPQDHPEVCDGSGEQDTPAHCSVCHRPLDYDLTSAGVRYVLEYLHEEYESGPEEWNKVHPQYDGTWYEGSRHAEITRDWAKEVRNYHFGDKKDELFVEFFLAVTAENADIESCKVQYQADLDELAEEENA